MLCKQLRRRRPSQQQQDQDRLMWASRKNVVVIGVSDRGRRYLSDFYTTLIDIQWRWNLLFFVVGFVLTWLAFAIYYYLLCTLHGDLDPLNAGHNSTWIPCVQNVQSFTAAYLFSIETMSTIGYGWRYQTEECPGVYLAVLVQSVIGAGLQFALASLVVSKTRRANRFCQTILFSNTAVIYQEDGQLKLAVRIGDMRKGDVIGAHATGMLIKKTMGKAGHKVPVRMFSVPFQAEGGKQKLFLCWPCLLIHTVDQHSPFWPLSRDQLLQDMYELIVILDGVAATTSKPFQARKSYHAWEIVWGHRFKALTITHDDLNSSGYVVNYSAFHHTFPVPVPFGSAQVLERKRLFKEFNEDFEDEDLDTVETTEKDARSVRYSEDRTGWAYSQSDVDRIILEEEDVNVHSEEESIQAGTVTPSAEKPTQRKSVTEATESTQAEVSNSINQTETPTTANQTEAEASTSLNQEDSERKTSTPARNRVRKISRVEFEPLPFLKGTPSERRLSIGDALNMYRHRRSVTDTYLGTELPEEETTDDKETSAAILTLVSQQNQSPDVKESSKPRRKSSTLQPLLFATEAQDERERGEAQNS